MFIKSLFTKSRSFRNIFAFTPIKRCSTGNSGLQFVGIKNQFTNVLKFVNKESYDAIPIYRVLEGTGEEKLPADYKVDKETLEKMYVNMVTINILDNILIDYVEKGFLEFHAPHEGEEGVAAGSVAALTSEDIIYAQYRENGVLLWRGYSMSDYINSSLSNCDDPAKGRQMAVCHGSKTANVVYTTTVLGPPVIQAAGSAYAFKREKKNACAVCYFGDGVSSEGDHFAGLNFAATLDCPVIFICRNNGFAISTSIYEQCRGDGVAARGPALGINTVRVDGNDVLAMYHATKVAREFCIKENKPVLIEAMTYRTSYHTTEYKLRTCDEYRPEKVVMQWKKYSPIVRFRKYLDSIGVWNQHRESELLESVRDDIVISMENLVNKPKPHWENIFTDVYCEMPIHIRKHMAMLDEHLKTFKDQYEKDL